MVCAFEKGYTVNEEGDVYYKDRKRSLNLDSKGYYNFTVKVTIDGNVKCTRVWVHRLQAYQKFKEKMFENNIEVRHLDSNCLNNKKGNIGIGTPKENASDKHPNVRMRAALIATSFVKIHNHEEIVRLHNEGLSYKKIMQKLNISSKGTINFIIKKSMESKK